MKNKFKIYFVDYGIANRFSNYTIEIHKKLRQPQFAPLLKEIIEHEKKHTDKGFNWKDFLLDLNGFRNKRLYNKFIISTPTAWVQFVPLYYSRDRYYWDWSVFFLWILAIIISTTLIRWITTII